MSNRYFFASVTRIADLQQQQFDLSCLTREQWATGDYVLGEVREPVTQAAVVELPDGRLANLLEGDNIIGAFGVRRATLEAVGDWQSIGEDHLMENLTIGGLFGKLTSKSFLLPSPTPLIYRGHVVRAQQKVAMQDFVTRLPEIPYSCPTILIIGTSMSAGKTTTARLIIHELKQLGLRVVGAKLTGAGRYRDILAMGDAGADQIFDFVDVGLPSSVVPPTEYRGCLRQLLTRIAAVKPDFVIAEAGASPLEPYNGSIVLEEIKKQIICTVLCASDPYAVIGIMQSFDLIPDLICGIATNTTAGVELVEKLTGIKALTLSEKAALPDLRRLLVSLLRF